MTRTVVFTETMADTVQGYVDTVRGLVTPGSDLFVEQRVDFTDFVLPDRYREREDAREGGRSEEWIEANLPLQFGTADAIILRPDGEMLVIDLKTGFRFVPVEHNTQLMLYALGAYRQFELSHGPTSVRLMIYQPQHGGMREWAVSIEDLMAFAVKARAAAQKVEEATSEYARITDSPDGDTPNDVRVWEIAYLNPDPNEDDCAFCRAMSTCPAKRAKLERVVGASFDVIAESGDTAKDHDWINHDSDSLALAMKCAGELEDFIKAVRAEVERRLLLGQPVEGFGLELGREGARAWTDPEAVTKYMRESMRLPIEKVFDLKLISPTTAEKLAGFKNGKKIEKPKAPPDIGAKQWAKLQTYIKRSPPVPSVKPVEAIKNPYTPTGPSADAFDAVGDSQPSNEELA